MRFLYFSIRFFPYWSLPLAVILGEVGWFFRRKHSSSQWLCWGGLLVIIALTVVWFYFRGDLNSDRWLRELFAE